jgi:hypothetical protein
MTWRIDDARLEAELDELGVPSTRETKQLLQLLATDQHALYTSLSRLSQVNLPTDHLPDVDRLVTDRMSSAFGSCTERSALSKGKRMSGQCRRLLTVLIRDVGTPVPLPELLLANALHSATPRRLRELGREHGRFPIRSFPVGKVPHYQLDSAEPDVDACCRYWIRSNLRQGKGLSDERRVLGLLSSELGRVVPRQDVAYVLPEAKSRGKGVARETSGAATVTLAKLVKRGYAIEECDEGVLLADLEPAR